MAEPDAPAHRHAPPTSPSAAPERTIAPLLARHEAFWRCEPAGSPLLGLSRWGQVTMAQFDWDLPAPEGTLEPEMLRVEHLLPQYEALFAGRPLDDDLCWPAMPPTAIPWLEAILGCPVRYSIPSGSMSAEPVRPDDLPGRRQVVLDHDAWFRKLLEFVEKLAGLARGRFAVGLPLMRGPWDLVAALLGTTELYVALYDRPDELRTLAAICADLWADVAARLEAAIPRWQGGYVGFLGLWAPSFDPMLQDDASVSVSPSMYRRVMRSADERMTGGHGRAIFHLHSAGLQVVDEVLDILDGRALNVDVDPSGPGLDEIVPVLRHVQARRVPLHLLTFDREQARSLAALLSPAGLAITYQPLDPEAARIAHPEGVR
jgi:hypothetical protein